MSSDGHTSIVAGVIGLGAMGLQMGRHLVDKGFTVYGHDISEECNANAREHGVEICSDIASVAKKSDVVIVMVQSDVQVVEVFHQHGLLAGLKNGSVVCITSSISPETCHALEADALKKNVGVLDTPVVLGQQAANEGRLTIFVGGDEKWLPKAQPVLEAFGRKVLHIGSSGNGQIAKTVNNMLLWATICANYEALSLAKSLGADLPKLIEALGHSSGANWSLSRWGKSTGKWAEKDMDVALELSQKQGLTMPLNGLVDQLMKRMNNEVMKKLLE